MKKITLSLFAAACSLSSAFSQPTYTIDAPPLNMSNGTTSLRAPNGFSAQATMRAKYTIPANELTSLGATILSFGFEIESGVAAAAGGVLIVYMQNSPSSTYTMGNTWSTTGMTQVYNGPYNLPNNVNPVSLDLNLPVPFSFVAGSALNIAYEYVAATSDPQFAAVYSAFAVANLTVGATESSSTAVSPTTLNFTTFRPVFRLGTPNPVSNDIEVVRVIAPGKFPKFAFPQTVAAEIRNNSNTALTNVAVGLAVTGSTTFANSQVIPSIASGATGTVTFAPFNSALVGANTLSVGVLPDQNNTNNTKTWTQNVTCDVLTNSPPNGVYTDGVGFMGPRMFLKQITSPASSSIKSLRIAIGSETVNIGAQIYGALVNLSGAIIATTNTIVITNTNTGTFQQFDFPTAQNVTSGTDYFLGCAQTASNTFPVGSATSAIDPVGLFSMPLPSGAPVSLSGSFLYLGLEAIYTNTTPAITALSTKSVICVGQTATITASGANTYTWTTPSTSVAASIAVSPTVTTVYTLTGADAGGCTNKSTFTQSVSACLGLSINNINSSSIELYPNPAINGKSYVSGLNGQNTIIVYNILGQTVFTQTSADETTTIDLSNQPNGTYLVKVIDSINNSKTVKLIVQN